MKLALATLVLSAVSVSAVNLAPRQASEPSGADDSASLSDSLACITALESAFAALPTPPPALTSYVEAASVTDICAVTLPARLEPVISSYDAVLGDWYSSNGAEITSALDACPNYNSAGTALISDKLCSTLHYSSSSSGSGVAAATTKTSSSSSSSTAAAASGSAQPTSNVGHHPTGAVAAAAMAVVGVLAVVAAL